MSIYNGERYLKESIESIINQTLKDFEFIIIDDGSTDKSNKIINSYNDSRIKLLENNKNIGLTKSLNKGLELCKGEFIARMDADDISLPIRLEKQVNYMEKNKNVDVCGSWSMTIGKRVGEIRKYPSNHEEIRCQLLLNNIMCHSSVIIREKRISEGNIRYNPSLLYAQDFDFFVRMINDYRFSNIPEVLIHYRIHDNQIAEKKKNEQNLIANSIIKEQLKKLSINPSMEELEIHNNLIELKINQSKDLILKSEKWMLKIIKNNDKINIYDNKKLKLYFNYIWLRLSNAYAGLGLWSVKTYFKSDLNNYYLNNYSYLKFIGKSIVKWSKIKKL